MDANASPIVRVRSAAVTGVAANAAHVDLELSAWEMSASPTVPTNVTLLEKQTA